MRYMFLIYENEAVSECRGPAEREGVMARYMALSEELRSKGKLEGSDPLLPTETATTVRAHDGEAVHVDGPFAETHEQLGGYYIIDCESLDEALGYAARIPAAESGCVEVRPIMALDG